MSRVLVAGAGYVGGALAERLAAQGHEVFALNRHPKPLTGARVVRADLTDADSLRALPEVDRVVVTAGADSTTDEAYFSTYVEGSHRLLARLRAWQRRPERIVFTSSTAVYAQQDGEWVDEDSPTEPGHFTGGRMLEAERVWRSSGLSCVVLRLGGIYGPARTRLLDRIARGEARYAPDQPQWVNRNHLDDCAAALEHLLFLADAAPVYIGSDCEPAEQRSTLEWLAGELGAPPPLPASTAGREGRGASNKRCSSRLLVKSGFLFRYPSYREGYAELIREYIGARGS